LDIEKENKTSLVGKNGFDSVLNPFKITTHMLAAY
jgi:hypothetical protein